MSIATPGRSGTRHQPRLAARRQRGVVLVVGLVVLVLVSLLGVRAMQSATLQERMASSLEDRNRALQAAEIGLRAGEQYVERRQPIAGRGRHVRQDGATALDARDFFDPAFWAESGDTMAVGEDWIEGHEGGELAGVARGPRFVIEEIPLRTGLELRALDERIYRVTAAGWGARESSMVVLQSFYRPGRRSGG